MKLFTYLKGVFLLAAFLFASANLFADKYTGLTATASSGNATLAVDNNMGSRWESDFSDPQYIIVDLGSVKNVGAIKVYWEAANAKDYTVSFSSDGNSFGNVLTYTNMAGGSRTDVINGLNVNCRYIKLNGTTRNLTYGYSIWEFEVYPPETPVLSYLTVSPAATSITLGQTQQFAVQGNDQFDNPFSLTNATNWSVDGTGASISSGGLFSSTSKGLYTVTAANSGFSKTATVEVLPANANLAIESGVTATASSGTASLAVDNIEGSRWESDHGVDPQWIKIDLGVKKKITDMTILWEGANAKDYTISFSNDDVTYGGTLSYTGMAGGARIDRIYDVNTEARYVLLTGTARNLDYGYSIWEFRIYGKDLISTGVDNISGKSSLIYPNPAKDVINIPTDIVKADFYTLQGQLIRSVYNNGSLCDVTDFPKGLYLVRLTDKQGSHSTQKLEIR